MMNLITPSIGDFDGLKIMVVDTWASGYAWRLLRPGRCPTKRQGRPGTRKAWKRKHPVGLRRRYGPIEPDDMLRIGDKLYCTARQSEALQHASKARAVFRGY
jgi:hypothetical protein